MKEHVRPSDGAIAVINWCLISTQMHIALNYNILE